MKRPALLLLSASLLLVASCSQTQKGSADSGRNTVSPPEMVLDGDWKFRLDPNDQGEALGWENLANDDPAWGTLSVPGLFPSDYDGSGWYRTTVTLPESLMKKQTIRLIFRQGDDHSRVYINGKFAIEHRSWSTPFYLDPLPFVGPDGRMEITVRVDDLGGPGGLLKSVEVRSVDDLKDIYKNEWTNQTPPNTLDDLGHLVMYSVYVRNFSEEGTFDALTARLPELQDLGVNILWLLPIHEIGVEKRKGPDGSPYAIKDYYSVDAKMGTKEDFKELVDAAHSHGMKVIIDCVMNHTSPDSVWAKEHPNWFYHDETGKPAPHNKDWSDIIDLDWTNQELRTEAIKLLEYWVRDMDIDGYRCDVADLIPSDWWKEARSHLDKIKPGEIVMMAESQEQRHYLNGFDITYYEGLRDKVIDITQGHRDASSLREDTISRLYSYPENCTQMLFVENHDKQRAINEFGGVLPEKAASVLTATLPGIPLLYTGTEVGAAYDRNETFFTRVPVDFSKDPHNLRKFWKDLLAFRAAHPALQTGDVEVIDNSVEKQVFSFVRREGKDEVLVTVNLSNEEASVTVDHELAPREGVTLAPWGFTAIPQDGVPFNG